MIPGAGTATSNFYGVYDSGPFPGFSDITGRTQVAVSLADGVPTLIFITAGQSIISNYNQTPYTPINPTKVLNFNIYNGLIYRLQDPVLGAGGTGGSYLGRLGDKLIAADKAQRVIFVTTSIGDTSTWKWLSSSPLGVHNHRLRAAYRYVRLLRWNVDAVLWDQGQGDLGNTSAQYQANVIELQNEAKAFGIDVPWFIAKDTLRDTTSTDSVVRAAQAALVNNGAKRYAGPDLDTLSGAANRYDTVHLSTAATDAAATAWVTALDQLF